MDNIITGAIAVAIFLAFVLGLAHSIAELPFVIIVVIVCAMICTDFYQSSKQGLKEERQKKSNASQ
jgi:4-hydroxybenzoate polyprenyltransferase